MIKMVMNVAVLTIEFMKLMVLMMEIMELMMTIMISLIKLILRCPELDLKCTVYTHWSQVKICSLFLCIETCHISFKCASRFWGGLFYFTAEEEETGLHTFSKA